jgi:hypothetical protein
MPAAPILTLRMRLCFPSPLQICNWDSGGSGIRATGRQLAGRRDSVVGVRALGCYPAHPKAITPAPIGARTSARSLIAMDCSPARRNVVDRLRRTLRWHATTLPLEAGIARLCESSKHACACRFYRARTVNVVPRFTRNSPAIKT